MWHTVCSNDIRTRHICLNKYLYVITTFECVHLNVYKWFLHIWDALCIMWVNGTNVCVDATNQTSNAFNLSFYLCNFKKMKNFYAHVLKWWKNDGKTDEKRQWFCSMYYFLFMLTQMSNSTIQCKLCVNFTLFA